uniref:Uncharacterized protein n=1 Tax=Acrobeloides nanus TaxID=290746 RepID=A0A914CZL8_9BILA
FGDQAKLLGSLNSYEDFSNAVDKTTLSRGQAGIDIALRILDSNFPRKNSSIPSYVIYFITANYGLTSSIKNTQGYAERFTKVTFVSLGSDAENLKKIFSNVIEWENWTTSKPKNWERKFLKAVGA